MSKVWKLAAAAIPIFGTAGRAAAADGGGSTVPAYAVIVSAATRADSEWGRVVEAVRARHGAAVHVWRQRPEETRDALRGQRPRHVAFVATPAEASRALVVAAHRLCRDLDDDPWGDCLWGIVTGFTASNALAIVGTPSPLVIRRGLGGTAFALDCVEEGIWYDEGRAGRAVRRRRGAAPEELEVPADTTRRLVDHLNRGEADLFITSGHATERDWQIGYSYRNGRFVSRAGRLFGVDTAGREFEIISPNPKVYLPVGNCLIGHIDGPDAMALAWLHAGGARQMIGYVVPTWFGYMGWGLLDYFVQQPGRFTLAEAFFANQQALLRELQRTPDSRGHRFDRDAVAFYGDPAWEARLAPGALEWQQTLTREGDRWTFTVTPTRRASPAESGNGSARGGRPIFQFLPVRIGPAEVIEGAQWDPAIADDFLMVPQPAAGPPQLRVVVRAAEAVS